MSTGTRAYSGGGYSAGPVTQAPAWHGLITIDILFNNLSSGMFLTAALAELTLPAVFTPLAKVVYPIALALLLADLVCLVLDLGDPWRFHHMLRVFKPTSPMSLGTWCLTVFSLPLTVAAVLSLAPSGWPAVEGVRKAAVIVGLLPALGVAAYKGVLLSTNAQPGWRDARWLGGYLANSALVLGCAAVLALAVLLGHQPAADLLRTSLLLLLFIHTIPLALLVANLLPTLRRIYTPRQLSLHAALNVGGILLPLVLLLAGSGTALVLTAFAILVAGSLATRHLIVQIPHDAH